MYTLYDCLQTGGVFVKAAFEEAGVEYRTIYVDVKKGEHLTAEFSRINPRQQLPVLRLNDDSILTEGVAIMLHIADSHPNSNLLPQTGSSDRAQVIRWLLFLATNIYEGENRKVHPERYVTSQDCIKSIYEAAVEYVDRHYLLFENELKDGPYFLGKQISLVDMYVWMMIQWHGKLEWLRSNCPKIHRLVYSVMNRPKIEPIHLENFGPGIGLSEMGNDE